MHKSGRVGKVQITQGLIGHIKHVGLDFILNTKGRHWRALAFVFKRLLWLLCDDHREISQEATKMVQVRNDVSWPHSCSYTVG